MIERWMTALNVSATSAGLVLVGHSEAHGDLLGTADHAGISGPGRSVFKLSR
jgi:hypothetical protein